jgi:subtilase family serine protease
LTNQVIKNRRRIRWSRSAAAIAGAATLLVPLAAAVADRPAFDVAVAKAATSSLGRPVGISGMQMGLLSSPASPDTAPVSPSRCAALYGQRCYGPDQIRRAYGVDKLHRRGVTGKGRTVAVIIPFHNPHLRSDVAKYTRYWGLPKAPLEVVQLGKVPTADPDDPSQAACAEEAAVDVQSIRALAPAAKIIVVETPVNQLGGTTGMQELLDAVGWVATHRHIDAISMSWGAYEHNFAEEAGQPGNYRLLTALRSGLRTAYQRNITLIAAAGNFGPTGPNLTGDAFYPHPSVAWPASDPLVTAVGGTRIHLTNNGHRLRPDELWTAEGPPIGAGATPGATSAVFTRPPFQNKVRNVVGERRGVVDIAANASGASREWFYSTYNALPGQQPGWVRVAGTSIAAPKVAAITALAAQVKGHRIGDIRPTLYTSPGSPRLGLHDLTTGTNTANGVPGYPAKPGYDLPSGVGTIHNAARLVTALADRTPAS